MYKYFVWNFGVSDSYTECNKFEYAFCLEHRIACFKLPLFGYHSNTHTGFSLSALRVPRSEARRPEK